MLGIYLGFSSADISMSKIIGEAETATCKNQINNSEVFETDKEKRCVTRFKSVGDNFVGKADDLTNKSRSLFLNDLTAQRVRPDEYNVYINQDETDKRVRRYNPRLDIFSRFDVKSFVTSNDSIKDYSVVDEPGKSIEQILLNKRCENPKLSKLKNIRDLMFFDEFYRNDYKMQQKQTTKSLTRQDFSAFNELKKKESWYMFFVGSQNYIENYLLANSCNQSISMVLNHCLVQPQYDMQLEEAFWFKQMGVVGINIYCKKSADKKWNYLQSKVMSK